MNIFISYTRESLQHDKRVAELANRLISELDLECDIDQFHHNQNWPAWMEERIQWADRVLVFATPTYFRRWSGDEAPGVGLGAKWESLLTRQHLYELEGNNDKFIPVVFDKAHIKFIPTPLRGYSRVVLQPGGSLEELRNRLHGIAPVKKPARSPIVRQAKLDEAYFPTFPETFAAKPASRARSAEAYDRSVVGLSSAAEEIISNLFPVEYPQTVYRAKPTRRTGRKALWDSVNHYWAAAGCAGLPPQDYVFEGSVYRFDDFLDEPWTSMIRTGRLRGLDPTPVDALAQSRVLAEKNIFIKMLTRSLTELCRSHDMAFSRELKCHLFVATNTRSRVVTVRSLSRPGTRVLCKAIPDRRASQPDTILHWQHQAFRHRFVRFGTSWFLSITPFWAFTADGQGRQKSRFQKSWSSKLRKPERNRAVLGHVLMWNSILTRDTDMLRRFKNIRIAPPVRLLISPSIIDDEWLKLARDEEKQILQHDLTPTVANEVRPSIS